MMIKVDNQDRWVEVTGSVVVDQVTGDWVLKINNVIVRTYATQQVAVDDAERVAAIVGVLAL
jgi:hypothetical protein